VTRRRRGEPQTSPTPSLPPPDVRLELGWGDSQVLFPSRVDGTGDGAFAVLAPLTPAGVGDPVDAGPLHVRWSTPRGVHQLPVERLAVETSGRAALWWLSPAGPLRTLQRRSFVRVPASLQVRLDGPEGSFAAVSFDVSEGGVGCRLVEEGADPWMFSGIDVTTSGLAIVTTVRTVRAVRDTDGRWSLGAGFVDLPGNSAAQLRRHVYTRQLALRRLATHAS
jgi:hypothetical protein